MHFTKVNAIHYGFIFFLVAKSSTDTRKYLIQGCTNPWRQLAWATEHRKVAPDICGPSIWNVLHVATWHLQLKGGGSYILENFCTPDIVILHFGYIKEFCSAEVQA